MVPVFVHSNLQVPTTIGRAAIDSIGEVLTDLIERFAQVVARSLRGDRTDAAIR